MADRFPLTNPSNQAVRPNFTCRAFLNGSCRFGSRCTFAHQWPAPPSAQFAQICRYFQKGGCWYGDQCRYLHILQPTGADVTVRRGSAADVPTVYTGNVLPERRGSEPALRHRGQGISRQGLRRSASVLPTVSNIQHNSRNMTAHASSRHMTTDTAEDEVTTAAKYNPTASQETRPEIALSETTRQEPSSRDTVDGGADSVNQDETEPSYRDVEGGGAAAAASVEDGGGAASANQEETEAFTQSKDITCGICMDKVYEKTCLQERRFGILPNCNHAFCLKCIATWRKTKDLREEVVKSCPQCRVKSPFYVPNNFWVEGQAKETLIATFKERSSKRRCSYFLQHGCCPFGSECLYWHDKSTAVPRRPRRRTPQNADHLDDLRMHLVDFFLMALLDDSDFSDDLYFSDESDF